MSMINRIMLFAGKTRREVSNPHITAREAIELANEIAVIKDKADALDALLAEFFSVSRGSMIFRYVEDTSIGEFEPELEKKLIKFKESL